MYILVQKNTVIKKEKKLKSTFSDFLPFYFIMSNSYASHSSPPKPIDIIKIILHLKMM